MTTAYSLAINRMYGQGAIRGAARHNLREIAAEMGADSHIDAARIRDNFILRGPYNAANVVLLAKSLLDAAGVTKFRKTAVRALELMFTLPAGTTIDPREYFERATRWAEEYFAVPVLSSIVHLDEGAPHCHVLLLPLVNNKMNGSDLHGCAAKLWAMQASFHEEVSVNYGFARQAQKKRISAGARVAGMARLRECFQMNTAISDEAIDVLLKPHAKDPESLLLALGIEMPPPQVKGKSFVAIMTAPCKPEPRNHRIGKITPFAERMVKIEKPLESYPYTCVGKGIALPSNFMESQHHPAAPGMSTGSLQAELCSTKSNNMPPLSRTDDDLSTMLVPTGIPNHTNRDGEPAPTGPMPEFNDMPTNARYRPGNADQVAPVASGGRRSIRLSCPRDRRQKMCTRLPLQDINLIADKGRLQSITA